MAHLMVGVSGIRGVYGDGLTGEIAEKFAYTFGNLYRGTIMVGRDSRVSGPYLLNAVLSGLRKAGADVINLGFASTPTTEMAVIRQSAAGGIIITASHNPREWNGLKFLGNEGVFLNKSEGTQLVNYYNSLSNIRIVPLEGSLVNWNDAVQYHVESILSLSIINPDLIASKHYKVCIDAVNGVGGMICAYILKRLGCEVYGINTEPTGEFSHGAEPVPENIGELCSLVHEKGADIGFAVDPDVDRLSLVDEKGKAIGEEYSLALAVDYCMSKSVRIAACNLSTSRMIDDVAARHGGTVVRSAVGEINVVELMKEKGAGIGGEGNGGIIYPDLHYGRDAVLGIALILQFMAESNERIGVLADSIPSYTLIKDKRTIGRKGAWIEPLKHAFTGTQVDTRDGMKFIFPDSWVHVRESNTEPIIRIFAEAPSEEKALMLVKKVYEAIN